MVRIVSCKARFVFVVAAVVCLTLVSGRVEQVYVVDDKEAGLCVEINSGVFEASLALALLLLLALCGLLISNTWKIYKCLLS